MSSKNINELLDVDHSSFNLYEYYTRAFEKARLASKGTPLTSVYEKLETKALHIERSIQDTNENLDRILTKDPDRVTQISEIIFECEVLLELWIKIIGDHLHNPEVLAS